MATVAERLFFTQKPREIYFETIELHHDQVGTLRFVARQYFDKDFGIESGAPRNAGQTVTFRAAFLEISPLTQSDNPVTSLSIQLGRVGQGVKSELRKIQGTGWFRQVECLYRVYRGSSLGGPLNVPPRLFISSISMEGDKVALTAEDDNPSGVTIGRKYLAADFPGLGVPI